MTYLEDLPAEMDSLASDILNASYEGELEAMAVIARQSFEMNFQMKRGPDGNWPPRKHDYPWPMLVKTGKLQASAIDEGAAGNLTQYTADEARLGSVVDYAGFHEYGTQKLPPRPWAWMSDDKIEEAGELLEEMIFKRFFDGSPQVSTL